MNRKNIVTGLRALVLVSGVSLFAGCATNTQTEEAEADAQQTREIAEQAQRTAQQALDEARAAREAIDSAQRCCEDQEERLDRALERMQQK